MTKKSPIIQQSKVTELMSQLASLPEREKAPDEPVSLSEIFRAKEYMTEIKGALKRGYSFDDLAAIFTERCGVDVGRVIKVYDQSDGSILAALQLAQQKWGGVNVTGTDEYKRKCAEIAAQHGIRVVNPELREVMKQAAENFQNLKSLAAPHEKSRLSPKEAWEIIKTETQKRRNRHMKFYNAYHEHKKALEALIKAEPEKPLLLGVKKWQQEYARWNAEKDALAKTLMEDLTALGCVMDKPERAEEEVERRHKSYREETLREAAALYPEAANVVRANAARKKQQEREAQEAEEAIKRQEKERLDALYREARQVMRQAGMVNEWTFVFDARPDGREYSGEILGIIPWEGKFVAVQKISPEMAILHRFKSTPEGLTSGVRLTIAHDKDDKITLAPEREKDQAVYRGR